MFFRPKGHVPGRGMPIHLATKMNTMEQPGNVYDRSAEEQFDKNFKPKGAIAFFVLLVILGLIIWYGIYFLMLERV